MTTIAPTVDQRFIVAFREAVRSRGEDYVYPNAADVACRYTFEDGTPGCIIGATLAIMGIKVPEVHEGRDAESLLRTILPDTSFAVQDAARIAQRVQDNGGTWGDAETQFLASLPENLKKGNI